MLAGAAMLLLLQMFRYRIVLVAAGAEAAGAAGSGPSIANAGGRYVVHGCLRVWIVRAATSAKMAWCGYADVAAADSPSQSLSKEAPHPATALVGVLALIGMPVAATKIIECTGTEVWCSQCADRDLSLGRSPLARLCISRAVCFYQRVWLLTGVCAAQHQAAQLCERGRTDEPCQSQHQGDDD
jgi:hypothetical protein